MEEIDLKQLFQVLLRRWWIIVTALIVFSFTSGIISFFFLQPIYQSNTSLYVGRMNTQQQSAIAYNDVLLGDRLVNDYRELVKSRLIAEIVIKELKLQDIDATKFAEKLSVNSKKDTRLIDISATDESPVQAKRIADKVAEVFKDKAVEIMKVENVQVIDTAQEPINPIKPNKKMNVAIAAVLGLMVGFGIVFLIEFFDNTLKTPEDIKKHLNLPVLGTIPTFQGNNQ